MKVDVTTENIDMLFKGLDFEKGGEFHQLLTSEIMRLSDPYVPFSSGPLKNTVQLVDGNTAILYPVPYARYQYFGKLMVDPITGKGAFFSPDYGFWSRPKTQKIMDPQGRGLKHSDGRTDHWTETAVKERNDDLQKMAERYVRSRI